MTREVLNTESEIRSFLHKLGQEAGTAEVLFENGENRAKVYLRNGLIIWAFSPGQRESFQTILLSENRISKEALLHGLKESRKLGRRNLDDILLALGATDEILRQTIMLRHIKAALDVVIGWNRCTAQITSHDVQPQTPAPSPTQTGIALLQILGEQKDKAPQSDTIDSIMEALRQEIPNYLAAMLIDGKTAMPIATLSDLSGLDIEVIGAFYLDLIKSAHTACDELGNNHEDTYPLDEILITEKNRFVLLKMLQNGAHFLYVLIDGDGNPGMARMVVNKYCDNIEKLLN